MLRIVILCCCLHEILRNTGCDLPGVFAAVFLNSDPRGRHRTTPQKSQAFLSDRHDCAWLPEIRAREIPIDQVPICLHVLGARVAIGAKLQWRCCNSQSPSLGFQIYAVHSKRDIGGQRGLTLGAMMFFKHHSSFSGEPKTWNRMRRWCGVGLHNA